MINDYENIEITDENIEQVLETVGTEVKGLSKEEFNEEDNKYFENLYNQSINKIYA